MLNLSGVVLAGGRSSRMGSDKAALIFGGKPLLAMQLERLHRSGCRELMVSGPADVGGPQDGFFPLSVRRIDDIHAGRGPLSGITSALSAMQGSHLLVLAVDLPLLNHQMLGRLVSAARPDGGVVFRNHGHFEPLAALYPAASLPDALAVLESPRPAVHHWLERIFPALEILEIADEDQNTFMNCNTPDDLERCRAIARTLPPMD